MQIPEPGSGQPAPGTEPCRFPKLEECAHFHYERVQLPSFAATIQTNMAQSLHSQHSQHSSENDDIEWYMVQVTSRDQCWLLQRNLENFKMLDAQLHQCIYDRKISQLLDLSDQDPNADDTEAKLMSYLDRFNKIADNSINCGPILNWFQMDNKGHRLLVPSEESRSINTPAVAAAYSIRRYVSQARDELNLEVGDMISVIDMANPAESMWWRGKRGFQVGFFPQHCVHIIGDKIPRNMPLPPPVVGSLALTPIKPVLRKHGKLITFFRSFLLNRPSRRRLKQSGILKERVFGCDLGEHLLNSGQEIPMVLKCCAEFIEAHGIVDGIYRLSGVNSNIQKLRNAFDEDRIPNLYTEDILQDIHSVACLLKMYFRELPNPLCTYQLYQSFVNAVQGCNASIHTTELDHERLLKMREAVQKLPPPHYRTLKYLMQHLARVAKHGANTGMTTRNVAIVWAPNLLRCEELEYGGVAALQGVGVQAVVTEFLICYADLIFSDRLPSLDLPLESDQSLSPKSNRPKSLAISTPTKLITLEEARSKILLNKSEECSYIEVGGGPKNLPKKYHTVIDLPPGTRKRNHAKRSPLGWRSFFSKTRNSSQSVPSKNNRKASTPGIKISDKSVTESDLTDMKRKLRSVKSAESLTSGHSEPTNNEIDALGPLHSLNKPPGHNRSVSHDSYFDTLQGSQNNSEGSLLDLSEIQLNFELEDLEMRIFSEDESLVSSPRVQRDGHKKLLTRARPEEFNSNANSGNPSPKKQARIVLSPDAMSRKRTRLEDQLSDIQFIDCCTPDNVVSTTAVVHTAPESKELENHLSELYQPKNKSPRNSDNLDNKRQSLNLEPSSPSSKVNITKSNTEANIGGKYVNQPADYRELESSANTTPSPDSSPENIQYQQLEKSENLGKECEKAKTPGSPAYENILTTISITYKSPKNSESSPVKTPVSKCDAPYENINLANAEKAVIPTSTASLPIQQASQPELRLTNSTPNDNFLSIQCEQRPRSLSALDDKSRKPGSRCNLSSSAICDTNEQISFTNLTDPRTFSSNRSNRSSTSNIQYTQSISSAPYTYIGNNDQLTPSDDLSLSEVLHSSTENITTSNTSLSFPLSPSRNSESPNVSPTQMFDSAAQEALTPVSPDNRSEESFLDEETENVGTSVGITQFSTDSDKIEESINARPGDISLQPDVIGDGFQRPASVNLIDFSPLEVEVGVEVASSLNKDKRKSCETEPFDDSAVYQQVKYFRRSIHEVNAMLDLESGTAGNEVKDADDLNIYEDVRNSDSVEIFDSLESDAVHVYENLDEEVQENDTAVYENVEMNNKTDCMNDDNCEKVSVRDLTSKFEDREKKACSINRNSSENNSIRSLNDNAKQKKESPNEGSNKMKRVYERDTLPPCLRARNLKYQFKTRSLDEEEFSKECNGSIELRKSLEESLSHKTNSLPKKLNQPKFLPLTDDEKLNSLHLSHSTENLTSSEEEQKKRERIEKYKEERRKFLHEKYRSESFKEDKDVLLSKLKIYKPKEDVKTDFNEVLLLKTRRRSKSGDEPVTPTTLEEEEEEEAEVKLRNSNTNTNSLDRSSVSDKIVKPVTESLRSRAAIFENQRSNNSSDVKNNKPVDLRGQECVRGFGKADSRDNIYADDFVVRNRNKDDDFLKNERRRHTFEARERETETDRLKRVSLDSKSPRKEKASASYCIKDMKAIFESKSKQ